MALVRFRKEFVIAGRDLKDIVPGFLVTIWIGVTGYFGTFYLWVTTEHETLAAFSGFLSAAAVVLRLVSQLIEIYTNGKTLQVKRAEKRVKKAREAYDRELERYQILERRLEAFSEKPGKQKPGD